ncbi:unnamed protein product [Zymoseptoria tritici ST99CH_1E4]|uniref:Uncharacterized protein n=1 Tax=Zymoseptoria tritici ST99CH_1E4 TaxID=1276532 RepID=A0A2H1FJ41_ZYMTR|nr:unnamed protein product [Zymoseptoria tritici ST99CH_1E4]
MALETNTVVDKDNTKNGCINIANGEQYPEDPQDYGECIFHSYDDRMDMMYRFQPWCTTSGYVQCCNAQGSETSTACDATGPPGAPLPPTKA